MPASHAPTIQAGHRSPTTDSTNPNPNSNPSPNPKSLATHHRRPPLVGRRRRLIGLALIGLLSITGFVAAAVVLQQDITVTPNAATPDVIFALGNDYTAINNAGFATATLGSSATSVTLTVNGIPGASDLQLGDLLKITNQDGTQGYNVTLTRSAAPDAAITAFEVQVFNATDVLIESWNAATAATGTTFSLPAGTTYDIRIDLVIADGTTVGALGGFDIQFDMVPT